MTVLAALAGYYDRLVEDGAAPPFGYSAEKISYAIVLSPDGEPVDVLQLLDTTSDKPRATLMTVPTAVKRTLDIAPNFLWDKTAYALGVTAVPSDRTADTHAAFVALHRRHLADSDDLGLRALLLFLKRWIPARFEMPPFRPAMLDANLVFRLASDRRYLHQRPAAASAWSRLLATRAGAPGLCLVTGETGPIARLHPTIKGVLGAQSSGAALVSFNLPAFESYTKRQGDNAPVSERAAFAYATGLNHLLRWDSGHRLRLGNATVVYWAEAAGVGLAERAEGLFSAMTDQPQTEESPVLGQVGDVLAQMAAGRPLREVADGLDGIRFYVLGLTPNAARLSVRFWYESEFGVLAGRFQRYWQDLEIEPSPWQTAPVIWRLLVELAVQHNGETIPPLLAGAVLRAILSGQPFPAALLHAMVARMRADHAVNGHRAAICKACLARSGEKMPVSLDVDEASAAYRLGRLFAVLEGIQRAALGRVNAGIRDRFYGAASATPARVFPLLLRNAGHHLSSLTRKNKGALAGWFERDIGAILAGVDSELPASLRIEDQGRFAVGYYHQRYTRSGDAPAPAVADSDDLDPAIEGEG